MNQNSKVKPQSKQNENHQHEHPPHSQHLHDHIHVKKSRAKQYYKKAFEFIKGFDFFAEDISDHIQFKGQTKHTTFFGGLSSIFMTIGLTIFFIWRIKLMKARSRVLLMSTQKYKEMDQEPPFYLKDNNFKIWAHFADPEFHNNDSRYLKIKMHLFSNLQDLHGSYPEQMIDMVECDTELMEHNLKEMWYPGKLWCPQYQEDHLLFANYNYAHHSWMRLGVHHCDPVQRAKEGKDCATKEQIDEYVHSYIFSLSYQKMTPTIDSADLAKTVKKYKVEADYSTPINNETAAGKEFAIMQNEIILDDQLWGVFDNPLVEKIVDIEQTLSYFKPNKREYDGYVYYYNFILSPTSKNYYRVSYTFLDVLGSVGGILECFTIAMTFILIPFKYNITQIRILKDYFPSEYKKYTTTNLTFQCLAYDLFKSMGILSCGTGFCLSKNFKETKENMDQIAGRYLELTNHVTNQQLGGANFEYDSDCNLIGADIIEDKKEIEAIEQMIEEIWRDYDDDGNGILDFEETQRFAQDFIKNLGIEEFDQDTFCRIFKLADKDGSGNIERDEIAMFVSQLRATLKSGNFKQDSVTNADVNALLEAQKKQSDENRQDKYKMINNILQATAQPSAQPLVQPSAKSSEQSSAKQSSAQPSAQKSATKSTRASERKSSTVNAFNENTQYSQIPKKKEKPSVKFSMSYTIKLNDSSNFTIEDNNIYEDDEESFAKFAENSKEQSPRVKIQQVLTNYEITQLENMEDLQNSQDYPKMTKGFVSPQTFQKLLSQLIRLNTAEKEYLIQISEHFQDQHGNINLSQMMRQMKASTDTTSGQSKTPLS